ncbi:MAG: ImmA/IrrE family metallo-endopeptidase [Anaerolineae bacterium]|nr:ImmA/IrrE family metallo-endopeptidase [Anaerolineae bacterium]
MSNLSIRPEMPYLTEVELENRASLMIARYETEFEKITKPPVPVEYIADFVLKLSFDWDRIEDTDESPILAYINPVTQTITMNETRRQHFDNFFGTMEYTIAHEIGHWDLHIFESQFKQGSLLDTKQQAWLCRSKQKDRIELQAEVYASYLLLPKEVLLPAVQGIDLCSWSNLYNLRDQFRVSITALRKRLEKLRMIYVAPDRKIYPSEAEYKGQKRFF